MRKGQSAWSVWGKAPSHLLTTTVVRRHVSSSWEFLASKSTVASHIHPVCLQALNPMATIYIAIHGSHVNYLGLVTTHLIKWFWRLPRWTFQLNLPGAINDGSGYEVEIRDICSNFVWLKDRTGIQLLILYPLCYTKRFYTVWFSNISHTTPLALFSKKKVSNRSCLCTNLFNLVMIKVNLELDILS